METPEGWDREGEVLKRTVEHKDFKEALAFVNAVGEAAEKTNHHPDIDIRWNKVTLALSTHSEGKLTDKDIDMASKINQLL
jgi:4a-hydroxytetrahydrobiopterin dehydratase